MGIRTNVNIKEQYFEWLYNIVCANRVHKNISYKKIFTLLHNIVFTFVISNDVNRAKDGEYLRYEFMDEIYGDEYTRLPEELEGPCSVLEMMIAAAKRCESIMDDTRYGSRTSQWFWNMMSNLGIGLMTDDIYDEDHAEMIIKRFLNRNYDSDGKGGLFYIRDCDEDLREHEIWTQLCWYLGKFI